ncbi:MAG: DUF4405 domain-containing protein [Granulosicoccaceae bacterium]
MKRSTVILLVDGIAFVGFLFLTSTGILLHFLLPPGSGRWSDIWGLNRHDWGDIHFTISMIFFSVLALHLILHWRVVLNLIKGRRSEGATMRFALGLVGLIAILLVALAPLLGSPNVEKEGDRHQRSQIRLHK